MDLAHLRREYEASGIDVADLAADPITQFLEWLKAAAMGGVGEPNAMVLSTAGADAAPSSRVVLLKSVDQRGFVFFTNRDSRKGRQIAANPQVSLLFPWIELRRQVVVLGTAAPVGDDEADAYFGKRPRGAQLGAWASQQSRPLSGRDVLDAAVAELAARFGEDTPIPRPAGWGGYRVEPVEVEFWQGRPNRLHDRLVYVSGASAWRVERRYP